MLDDFDIEEDEISLFHLIVKPALYWLYPMAVLDFFGLHSVSHTLKNWVHQSPWLLKIILIVLQVGLGIALWAASLWILERVLVFLTNLTEPQAWRECGTRALIIFQEIAKLLKPHLCPIKFRIMEELVIFRLFLKYGNFNFRRYFYFRASIRGDSDDEDYKRNGDDMNGDNQLNYQNACALLGLPGNESFDNKEFKHRYRQWIRRYHPDKPNGSVAMSQSINEAAKIIKQRRHWK